MREEILRMGGEVRFHSQMTEILTENGQVTGVKVNDTEVLPCEQVVLAPGTVPEIPFHVVPEAVSHVGETLQWDSVWSIPRA